MRVSFIMAGIRRTVLLLLCGWAGISSTWASASPDDFARGNELYAAGKFPAAAAAYEAGVQHGQCSANLFYNLGDAYYRVGDRGRAMLNYRRALLLEPAHAEAAANLAFVTGKRPAEIMDQIDANGPTRLSWLTAAAGWLAAAGVLLVLFQRRWRTTGMWLTAIGLAGCAAGSITLWRGDRENGVAARAMVIVDGAPALYSPADNSRTITKLPLGAEVRVLSAQGAWMYAALDDGARGWMAADKVQRLVPAR